ncbi:MAG TPA: MFS transporter [Polyangia bacterium]
MRLGDDEARALLFSGTSRGRVRAVSTRNNEGERNAGPTAKAPVPRAVKLAVLVAALGYFVDIYDLILFSVVRVKSLEALGVTGAEGLSWGLSIINWQMLGMLFGGVLWGIWGDLRGRLSVLFGSIVLYSLANLANAFPDQIASLTGGTFNALEVYRIIRFLAGVGLAGELGAGITLVSESMGKEHRGFGTTIVASVGICGAIVAVLVGKHLGWRTAYVIGGVMGLALLGLRLGVRESGMFENVRRGSAQRGNFIALFTTWPRIRRYFSVILVGVPIWYVIGVLVTFSPELGRAMGMADVPKAPDAVLAAYSGLVIGDFASGFSSQMIGSRKKILLAFISLTAVFVGVYFTVAARSTTAFYATCVGLGIATGYWAVFVTVASEQFGTNIRATVTTTAPNFVRGSLVPVTLAFEKLRETSLGIQGAALVVGAGTILRAVVALLGLDETHGKDLDFLEE